MKIPGVVFKGYRFRTASIVFLLIAALPIFFEEIDFQTMSASLIFSLTSAWLFYASATNPLEVYINETSIRVMYENGDIFKDSLENYFLYIVKQTRQTLTSNFTYNLCLIHESCITFDDSANKVASHLTASERRTRIPIMNRVLTIGRLKSVIQQLQNAIDLPIDVIFPSDDVLQLYRSTPAE